MCFSAGGERVTWSQRRKGGLTVKFLCWWIRKSSAFARIHYSWVRAERITAGFIAFRKIYPLWQGSVLQIHGPRGFKGSKGDAVRSSWSFSNLLLIRFASKQSNSDQKRKDGHFIFHFLLNAIPMVMLFFQGERGAPGFDGDKGEKGEDGPPGVKVNNPDGNILDDSFCSWDIKSLETQSHPW